MRYMGFQIVFTILKIKKSCKLTDQMHFQLQLENQVLRTKFCRHKVFGIITKATMVHHLTLEKTHFDGPNFFKIYNADLF